MYQVALYDTTLRDGAQQEGIALSVEDKLRITQRLDAFGIPYIEGGWPGSNPKDAEYFARVRHLPLKQATVVAFGSTRKAHTPVEQDANIRALLEAQTAVVTLVGKTWDLHVTRVLETSLEENLAMIRDSIVYLRSKGRRVFFDAEHFFDGWKANRQYALRCIQVAAEAGAACVVLCDTNGGSLPHEVASVVQAVRREVPVPLGIHTHNDGELAVANALAAVQAGVVQVQGTINGYGERCGNANLVSLIPALHLKLGIPVVPDESLPQLTALARWVSEVVNRPLAPTQPYVGSSAFVHKGGLHASGVMKVEESYQHIPPEAVGNTKRIIVSELAGRGNVLYKMREVGLPAEEALARRILEVVKEREARGFQYEEAEASFELLVRREQPGYRPPFELVDFLVVVEKRRRTPENGGDLLAEATVKVRVNGQVLHTAAEGNGPVNALDNAVRKALQTFYPQLEGVRLVDYKVRVVDQGSGTGASVRVLMESTDGQRTWRTVGASTNIIEASWLALQDSLEWWIVHRGLTPIPHK
ncbi:MAG: citramalate synthase [Dehalococcoidia bacterium]|nr:citramalate synthase [Dehalococcoidia bacterium]MDW8120385.1 citramalate synthase [Chloroflexota bacterium]